ncbi:cytochrome C [Acidiphilium sp.]|uniref:cytochrome C n=1 Tax=Acidiphilium sp. TaxID=527 RepID=UPI003D076DF3
MFNRHSVTAILTAALFSVANASAATTSAAKASTAKTATANISAMRAAVARGAKLFKTERFGSTRIWVPDMAFHNKPVTCETCHTNGGTTIGITPAGEHLPSLIGSAADFPRYNPKKHTIFTLQRQLVHCIRAGLGGTAPAYDSPAMIDLEVYLISLSKRTPIGKNVPSAD